MAGHTDRFYSVWTFWVHNKIIIFYLDLVQQLIQKEVKIHKNKSLFFYLDLLK